MLAFGPFVDELNNTQISLFNNPDLPASQGRMDTWNFTMACWYMCGFFLLMVGIIFGVKGYIAEHSGAVYD